MVQIIKDFVPSDKARRVTLGGRNKGLWITIHDTGNTARGADARMHAKLQRRGNDRQASWHIQVDDKEAIQSFPYTAQCMHCTDGRRGNGNCNSIGIERCINADSDPQKSFDNTVEVTKQLMKELNVPASRVVRHADWYNKKCPRQMIEGRNGLTWALFKSRLTGASPAPTKAKASSGSNLAGARLIKNENAFFKATSNIKIRNQPNTRAKHTGTLPKGASINYRKVYEGNGYRWLEYTGNSGNTLYCPYRESGKGKKAWGTFHDKRPK